MEIKRAIKLLKQKRDEATKIASASYIYDRHIRWRRSIEDILEEAFTVDSTEYKRIANIKFSTVKGTRAQLQRNYVRKVNRIDQEVGSIIEKHESLGIEERPEKTTEPPKVFIAHEGMTKSLTRLEEFLHALGVEYLIAEIEASNGRGTEKQVQWTQGKADFAIILATRGKAIDKKTGESYMGLNVADELGRAREVFKNHIILLLQKGVKAHTNISGIVYEPFTPQNLEKAFIKIMKELRNWGFIKVGK